ncbi:MAG: flotillin domain-containing protein, partial [Candidatus Kapaibacterium sp.]
ADKVRRMREADAQQYQIEASAKAQAEQKRLEGLAIADAERAKGTADAEVTKLKGLAEAEAKEKLAEAFEKYGQAAIIDIVAKMLPEFAGRIAEPMKHIDKLTVVDTGSGEGAARLSNYVTTLMAQSGEMLKNVSGIDLEKLIKGVVEKYGGDNNSQTVWKQTEDQ